jgi:large subunit ribosomal protein L18
MGKANPAYAARERRHRRVRKHLAGTSERPRLNIFRSLNHIYVQVIDDAKSVTLISASSLDVDVAKKAKGQTRTEQAKLVGQLVAERALKAGVNEVVFDRGGYKYHGRVKALAEASRKAGLKF